MKPTYQTRLPSVAKIFIERGFKYTKKNNIWEFEYTKELCKVLETLRDES